MTIRKFGWIPDTKDERDFQYLVSAEIRKLPQLPKQASVLDKCPKVYQQGDLGSCVGNAVGGAIEFIEPIQKITFGTPSRLFIYYNAREIEGTTKEDSGCMIRNAIKSVVNQGVCPETSWPYIISNFAIKPDDSCYQMALGSQVISYHRIGYVLSDLKSCIIEGFPFTVGIQVYENFPMDTSTGLISMPQGQALGGHAVDVVGYDDISRMFVIRNSWGEEWGDNGYGYLPYDYLTNPSLASDFWTIRSIEDSNPIAAQPSRWNGCLTSLISLFKPK
jgi:C1A family cysteine protease